MTYAALGFLGLAVLLVARVEGRRSAQGFALMLAVSALVGACAGAIV